MSDRKISSPQPLSGSALQFRASGEGKERKIIPKKENEGLGFQYSISDEQVEAYSKLSVREKFAWLESINEFIYKFQTPEERERMYLLKGKNTRL